MNAKTFFKSMYFNIWQGHDITRIAEFYAPDFEETICTTDINRHPHELHMNYQDLCQQAHWQKEHYQDTTFEIRKCVTNKNHIAVQFYSTSIDKKTGELRHRHVCGIWRLNRENRIDRVWAVVTPYYC